jgi:hypothetical protein
VHCIAVKLPNSITFNGVRGFRRMPQASTCTCEASVVRAAWLSGYKLRAHSEALLLRLRHSAPLHVLPVSPCALHSICTAQERAVSDTCFCLECSHLIALSTFFASHVTGFFSIVSACITTSNQVDWAQEGPSWQTDTQQTQTMLQWTAAPASVHLGMLLTKCTRGTRIAVENVSACRSFYVL